MSALSNLDTVTLYVYLLELLKQNRKKRMTVAAVSARVQALKDKLNQTYETISTRTDNLVNRLEQADQHHSAACNEHCSQLDEIEKGVAAVEQLARQMSNGGPTQDSGGSKPLPKADQNGVVINPNP